MPETKKTPYHTSSLSALLPSMVREESSGTGPTRAFDWLRGQKKGQQAGPAQMRDIFHGQAVLNTFAKPHGLMPSEMIGHLREIWKEEGLLPPAETLIRLNERVVPSFKHDDKMKAAIQSNFPQDPFTGLYSKDAAAVAMGLGHLYAVTHNLPCTLIPKADVRNLKGMNDSSRDMHRTAGFTESRPSPDNPMNWKEPAWRTHVNDIVRVMVTRGMRRIQQVASTLAPEVYTIGGRAGGDEVDILCVGIDKGTFDRGVKPELYKSNEEVTTSFGLLHLFHPKHKKIIHQGINLIAGTLDLTGPGRWNEKKNEAVLEGKVDALTLGTIRHLSQSEPWSQQVKKQFDDDLDAATTSKSEKRRALKMAEELAHNMHIALLSHANGPSTELRQQGQRNSNANRLERSMFYAAEEMRKHHKTWGSRFRTALPVDPTPNDGYAVRPLTPNTARNLIADREALYRGVSADAIFAPDYIRPVVQPAPADPFIRRGKRHNHETEGLFRPTWVERQPMVTRHLRYHNANLPPEAVQQLAGSIASVPSIDPPTGFLMPDTFKAQIERWGQDTEELRQHASAQMKMGEKATDPLLVKALTKTKTKPEDLRTFVLMVEVAGLTALNAEAGNADADLWLGDAARRLKEICHDNGFHITNGKERGNAVACHAGAGRFLVNMPPVIERNGQPHFVNKNDVLACGAEFAKSMNGENGLVIGTHLQSLGGATRSRMTYGELANKRAGAEKEVGVGAFFGATLIRLPNRGHNAGGQFFETVGGFLDRSRARRLHTRYENLPEHVKPSEALKKLQSTPALGTANAARKRNGPDLG